MKSSLTEDKDIANAMAVDDLVTQGTKASGAMALTYLVLPEYSGLGTRRVTNEYEYQVSQNKFLQMQIQVDRNFKQWNFLHESGIIVPWLLL